MQYVGFDVYVHHSIVFIFPSLIRKLSSPAEVKLVNGLNATTCVGNLWSSMTYNRQWFFITLNTVPNTMRNICSCRFIDELFFAKYFMIEAYSFSRMLGLAISLESAIMASNYCPPSCFHGLEQHCPMLFGMQNWNKNNERRRWNNVRGARSLSIYIFMAQSML